MPPAPLLHRLESIEAPQRDRAASRGSHSNANPMLRDAHRTPSGITAREAGRKTMQCVAIHELAWVAGGKTASGGKLPTASSPVTASGAATVSGSSNTTTTVTVVCTGSVTTQIVLWGAWQKTQCESSAAGTPKEAPKPASPASNPASGAGASADGQWKPFYWHDMGNQ